jgi:Uri superfamily endonuclease
MIKDYQQSKIYIIRSYQTDKIYIGSTMKTLNTRFSEHKSTHNRSTSKIIIDYKDAYIELLELYPCNSRNELYKREGQLIILNKEHAVNKNIAGRSHCESVKEYQIKNKESMKKNQIKYYTKNQIEINEKRKEYYTKNHIEINEKYKEYYQQNKEKISINNKLRREAKKLAISIPI